MVCLFPAYFDVVLEVLDILASALPTVAVAFPAD